MNKYSLVIIPLDLLHDRGHVDDSLYKHEGERPAAKKYTVRSGKGSCNVIVNGGKMILT